MTLNDLASWRPMFCFTEQKTECLDEDTGAGEVVSGIVDCKLNPHPRPYGLEITVAVSGEHMELTSRCRHLLGGIFFIRGTPKGLHELKHFPTTSPIHHI